MPAPSTEPVVAPPPTTNAFVRSILFAFVALVIAEALPAGVDGGTAFLTTFVVVFISHVAIFIATSSRRVSRPGTREVTVVCPSCSKMLTVAVIAKASAVGVTENDRLEGTQREDELAR
jgi:hypothetical protein